MQRWLLRAGFLARAHLARWARLSRTPPFSCLGLECRWLSASGVSHQAPAGRVSGASVEPFELLKRSESQANRVQSQAVDCKSEALPALGSSPAGPRWLEPWLWPLRARSVFSSGSVFTHVCGRAIPIMASGPSRGLSESLYLPLASRTHGGGPLPERQPPRHTKQDR